MGSEENPAHHRKRQPPLIAGRQFSGYGVLEAEINRIRREYLPHNQPVAGADGELLGEWMAAHESIDDAVERHGPVQHIELRWNPDVYKKPGRPEHDRNQITLVFADGFAEPFGYQKDKNLFGVIPSGFERHKRHWRWLKTAGRCLIADDIREFRDVHLGTDGHCEISGTTLSIENVEIHHRGVTFGWMLYGFLSSHLSETGLSGFDIEVIDTDSVGGKRFADEALCDAWVAHHCAEADLQALEMKVHRQQHVGLKRPNFLNLFEREKSKEASTEKESGDWGF